MHKRFKPAFTIVELLIVVVVIAILAAVTIVSYNGISRQANSSVAQNLLRDAAKAMEVYKINNETYPNSLPESVSIPSGFGIAFTEVEDTSSQFCLNVTTQRYDDLLFSVDQSQSIKPELCAGSITAIYGDYNQSAVPPVDQSPWLTASTVGRVASSGPLGLTAETNENWSQVTLSWNAIEGATRYRLNHSTDGGANWYTRNTTDGSSGFPWDLNSTAYSGGIPSTTTSVTWTNSKPVNASQSHLYRLQYLDSSEEWSDWEQVTLSPLDGKPIPTPTGFTVVPSDGWGNIQLSWDGIGNYANMPGIQFRLNHSTDGGANWYTRKTTDGSSGFPWDLNSTTYSGRISPNTNSLTWSNANSRPANASQVHMYRLQLYSGSEMGQWVMVTLDPLEGKTMPRVSNFSVVPSSSWDSISISWDEVRGPNIPALNYRLNHSTDGGANWYTRKTTDGSSGFPWDMNSTTYSGSIPLDVTSVTWTSSNSRPGSAGVTHLYRIQTYSGSATSPWTEFSLTR